MYHSAKSARERDIYRQRFLQNKGWIITRIWSRNWWQNPEKDINRLEVLLKELTGINDKSEFQVVQATGEAGSEDRENRIGLSERNAAPGLTDKKAAALGSHGHPNVLRIDPKRERPNKPAEVVKLKPKQSSPSVPSSNRGADGKSRVRFGDRVTIEDVMTLERFDVDVEENPYNGHLMGEIQKLLIDRNEGASFSFRGQNYRIAMIIDSADKQPETVKQARFKDELY